MLSIWAQKESARKRAKTQINFKSKFCLTFLETRFISISQRRTNQNLKVDNEHRSAYLAPSKLQILHQLRMISELAIWSRSFWIKRFPKILETNWVPSIPAEAEPNTLLIVSQRADTTTLQCHQGTFKIRSKTDMWSLDGRRVKMQSRIKVSK